MNGTIKILQEWGLGDGERPLIISGPCSAETPEQLLETASDLSSKNIGILRAGIWKPRTRPGSFEGVGAAGLGWLKQVKTKTGMQTAIEVANTHHVNEALKADIDILWIGARTTGNPFALSEIADSLAGVNKPVFIKNPLNPDVELWNGAIERFANSGIKKIGAIHRGFSTYENSIYRNPPYWQIPIELKRRLPQMPMLCDPSHIAGNRSLLQSIAQKAMDLNYDGLMIESHCNPDAAWSDKEQQITPGALSQLLSELVIRRIETTGKYPETLEELRSQINFLDEELLDILQKRMEVSKAIGWFKKENNMTIFQPKRWAEILENGLKNGEKRQLSDRFILNLFKAIHEESIGNQTAIMNNGK
jgi:chorismate mutase